mmetsp:Transcript_17750/g.49137  ORF Transcript_17750/g.49137 Transcript_17750/m.49137 type:complete len:126 (-) Transcript_17750:950-1327(-)
MSNNGAPANNLTNASLCILCSSSASLPKTPTDPLFWVIVALLCVSFPVFVCMCLQTRTSVVTRAEDGAASTELCLNEFREKNTEGLKIQCLRSLSSPTPQQQEILISKAALEHLSCCLNQFKNRV